MNIGWETCRITFKSIGVNMPCSSGRILIVFSDNCFYIHKSLSFFIAALSWYTSGERLNIKKPKNLTCNKIDGVRIKFQPKHIGIYQIWRGLHCTSDCKQFFRGLMKIFYSNYKSHALKLPNKALIIPLLVCFFSWHGNWGWDALLILKCWDS